MQGKLPTREVGEEKVVNPPTMGRHGQVQQLRTKGMPVAQQEAEMSGRETPVQGQEEVKKAENKTGLPDRLKDGIETMSGFDLSGVRVNYNSPKPAKLNAHAYTQGQEIEVAPGQKRHVPHEAWHVVQQMEGRVKPTMEVNGYGVNGDRRLEQEADVMGQRVLQMRSRAIVQQHSEEGVLSEGNAHPTRSNDLTAAQTQVQDMASISSSGKHVMQLTMKTGTIMQRKALTHSQQQQLADEKVRLKGFKAEYDRDKSAILDTLQVKNNINDALDYLHAMDLDGVRASLTTLDKFFVEIEDIALRASSSDVFFRQLVAKLKWYEFSGGKNTLVNALGEINRKLKSTERNDLNQITELDEKYFTEYLKKSKAKIKVYRGDGRSVGADYLNKYVPADVVAGGNKDISFYGVVQHTHTSTQKNGMVSTTTDRKSAHKWATDGHTHGVVFEFELTDYINVGRLLESRNFKNRFAAQKEILVPGNIPKSAIKKVTLYKKDQQIQEWSRG
ncbi:MAG: DUF4157 domain-containing protein [Moorea sp. SIO4A3]|nr:DUF4157 domain-containing protein [Moorena sp. SIO4A3]